MAKVVLLWHILVTVLMLAERQWSLCDSTELRTSYQQSKSRAASVLNFDSSSDRVSGERTGRAASRFNLEVGSASGTHAMPAKESSRLIDINLKTSSMEVEVLLAFKNGISSDPLGVLHSWNANDSDPCSWRGVECSKNSMHVTSLNLGGLRLEGTVSASLGQLSLLQLLDLSNNFLQGYIPTSLTNCSNLLHLNISSNQMIGDIPALVGHLENLQTLDLSSNNLTGEIPTSLGNCSSLQQLILGMNSLGGGIPYLLGRLSNLRILLLLHNSLSGSVPSSLGNCSSLEVLRISDNAKLGGALPLELGQLIHLQELSAGTCEFQGSFPTWILNNTAMRHLDLFFNQISGQIPETLGQLLNLNELRLGENVLSGEIPKSITNMTLLQALFLDQNQFTGTIPHDVGLLQNLESLQLFNNALNGLIPSSLSNCSLLRYLYIGVNPFDPQPFPPWIGSLTNLIGTLLAESNLEGKIPEAIGLLSQLHEFLVYANNLTGVIPPSLGNCTALFNLDLSENQLSGEIPSELGLLPNIIYLVIGINDFRAGPFPAFFYNLTTMVYFDLEENQFNGLLDGDFGRFQQLTEFNASDNNFQGPIPESFANCSELNTLNLALNNFSEGIPLTLANLTKMEILRLGGNHFYGSIPVGFVKNFQLLQDFDLSDNNFGGIIPVDIGQLVSLQYLLMSGNDFTGGLPNSLANCTQLLVLDLSQNRLTGRVPGDAFATMSSLTELYLSHNSLSGSWPSQLSQLTKLQVINISANNMSGPIPLGLGGCLLLATLDLSFNQFTGAVPQDLGLLKYLATFNASYNNFSGPIPDSGAFKANLTAASFLGNPGLCGRILGAQRQCRNLAPELAPSPAGDSHCSGFKCAGVWIPVASAFGTIIILIGVSLLIFRHHAEKDDVRSDLVMYTVNPHMRFTEADIMAAIASGKDNVIGIGARSVVYKAISPGGEIVAIKVVKNLRDAVAGNKHEDRIQWEKEIANEANTLRQLRHRNVIKAFSLFNNLDIKAIILEYMPRGSLHAHLHGDGPTELTWAERFKILLGVTHGMVYFHHEFPDPIIHRDLKPSNILLDEDMEPKVSDFGISKFVTSDNEGATASTICGTLGYMAPEYGTGTRVSTKGDVYSFGVVLLELLTAKAVTQSQITTSSKQMGGLVDTVQQSFQGSEIQPFELVDPTLKKEADGNPNLREKMLLTLRVGLYCTKVLPRNRPSMNVVLQMLLEIDKLGQEATTTERTLDDLLREDIAASDYEVHSSSE